MRNQILFICLFISVPILYAQQDYTDWLKQQQQGVEEFKGEQQDEYQHFKDARDSAFAEFLKQEWRAFEVFQGLVPDETPMPVNAPSTTPKPIPEETIPVPSQIIGEIRVQEEGMVKVAESIEVFLSKLKKEGEALPFTFFGAPLEVNYDKALVNANLGKPINQNQISGFWAELSRSKYEDLLEQTFKLRDRMRLNDWGYCLLLNQIADGLYPDSENKRKLFIWFMLSKSGYVAKVGYVENEVVLLLPSIHVIYRTPYFIMGGQKYYVASFDLANEKAKSLYTYEGNYPDAPTRTSRNQKGEKYFASFGQNLTCKVLKLIALDIENPPVIRQDTVNKALKFQYNSEEFIVQFAIKKDAIDFYYDYPQTDYEVYFDAALSPEARHSLAEALKPIIEGKTEVEAVNMLLRFVQTAFVYQTDEVQFGRQKPFFAEETLFYPYSDCKDRAVLFAYLVRTLLGLEVIGLDYPGHISTAVKFHTEIHGDCVEYSGCKYIICDATYINANIGQCMTKYKNIPPLIIQIGHIK